MPVEAPEPPAGLLTGWPGSGKSTVGRALAGRIGAALVDQDTVTAPGGHLVVDAERGVAAIVEEIVSALAVSS